VRAAMATRPGLVNATAVPRTGFLSRHWRKSFGCQRVTRLRWMAVPSDVLESVHAIPTNFVYAPTEFVICAARSQRMPFS